MTVRRKIAVALTILLAESVETKNFQAIPENHLSPG